MTLDFQGVLRDAWAIWRRDRAVLIPLAGVFYFLPQLALRLFVLDPRPAKGGEAQGLGALIEAMQQFYLDHLPALIAVELWTLGGTLAVLTLYLRPGTSDARAALAAMVPVVPAYLLLALLVNFGLALGFAALIVPGYYLFGRLILAGPILVAEQPLGAIAAIERSWVHSRRRGFAFAGLGALATVAGYLIGIPIEALGQALDSAPLANPVSAVLIDAAGSTVVAATMVATTLIRVALYRRIGAG